MAIIEFNDVTMTYGRGRKKAAALRGVSLSIEEGAFAVLMGPAVVRPQTSVESERAVWHQGIVS